MALRYLKNVVTLRLDSSRCTGCGMCVEVCPHGVFQLKNGKATMVDLDACMECGACEKNCAFGAISVRTGVGCASALITALLRRTSAECGCGDTGFCAGGGNSYLSDKKVKTKICL